MGWTKDQLNSAIKTASEGGGTLPDHAEYKLREAANQAGSDGNKARAALRKYDSK